MNNQILATLKKRLEEISTSYGEIGPDVQRNAVKEALQYYVLNFIYHHPKYSNWIMYGGSTLRICHDLDRMSVDLDFEVDNEITNDFLNKLKDEIIEHFKNTYGVNSNLLTIGTTNNRGLTLKFLIGEELNLGFHSKQIHIKIDLNHFAARPRIVTERWPQNEYQLSFVIKTYNMSALMASKIAAVFLRGPRGVGEKIYGHKGRDIYDLLWYMRKKIVPDLDYLKAKNVKEAKDLRTLFDKITINILNDKGMDENLKQDLTPLFIDQTYIQNWLNNWRESYMRLHDEYEIHTVTELEEVGVRQDFHNDVFSFVYWYKTDDGKSIKIIYRISDYWIEDREGDLLIEISKKIKKLYRFDSNGRNRNSISQNKLMRYAELFYKKTENYLKKTERIMIGSAITTKLIRMTADNLNQKEQILLNKSSLLSCELDDLLK
ncbi:nucleotidyl transferase AbiEii/AbiGii toxin family protein [Candidatus Parcubacteria bacterium]|nr:nucleotidyl transferase AbiEii/AbiGii toxin family protein [Candidatus Parcubacteria bacterium]